MELRATSSHRASTHRNPILPGSRECVKQGETLSETTGTKVLTSMDRIVSIRPMIKQSLYVTRFGAGFLPAPPSRHHGVLGSHGRRLLSWFCTRAPDASR